MAQRDSRKKWPLLKPLHTWIGIVAGLFLSVVAATGSVIIFRAEFERAGLPKGAPASGVAHRAALDEAGREIARLRPGSHIRRVRLAAATEDPYIFQVESTDKKTERIVSDASTGQVLGTVETGKVDRFVDLHRNLLWGKQGRQAIGIEGIVLFVLSTTGLMMWWTGARSGRAWISVRGSGSRRRFNFELHRASGLWAYAFLSVIAFTGIERVYPDTFRSAIMTLTGKPATVPGPKGITSTSMGSLDEYVRVGHAAMPDGVPIELRLPAPGKGPVDLRLYRAGDFSPSGNHVYLDPDTTRVIQVDRIVDRPAGARFLAALAPIHYGQFGGIPVKIAWALLGLSPVLLFVTGLFAWWRPAKRKSIQPVPETSGDFALAGRQQ